MRAVGEAVVINFEPVRRRSSRMSTTVEPSSLPDCMGFVVSSGREGVEVDSMSSRALSIRQDCGLRHGSFGRRLYGVRVEEGRCSRRKEHL